MPDNERNIYTRIVLRISFENKWKLHRDRLPNKAQMLFTLALSFNGGPWFILRLPHSIYIFELFSLSLLFKVLNVFSLWLMRNSIIHTDAKHSLHMGSAILFHRYRPECGVCITFIWRADRIQFSDQCSCTHTNHHIFRIGPLRWCVCEWPHTKTLRTIG